MSRVPIRLRVTLTFAAVMALVLTALGLFVYLRQESQLNESLETALRSRATEVAALAGGSGDRLSASGADPLVEQDESFAQLVTESGTVIDSTPQVGGAEVLDPATLERAAAGSVFAEVESVPGIEGTVRLLATPVQTADRTVIAVVGSSLGDRDESLAELARLLALGGAVALLAASLAGYAMAGAALRPVDAMRRRAAEISATERGARLPVPQADDELRRLGETLNAMLERLETALARERRFVDDASHELRTPLALHKVELELALLHAADEDELRAAIASATDEIDRLIGLAEQLLVVARTEEGAIPIERERIDAEELLGAIATRFAGRAERAARPLTYEVEPPGTAIDADRLRLEQALTNLVENALRHGDGAVRLGARANGSVVELHVTDEGPGIPPEFIGRAFERFSRADAARARGGTGLGLAVVDSIARAHGGGARARNVGGGGADVWIELPSLRA